MRAIAVLDGLVKGARPGSRKPRRRGCRGARRYARAARRSSQRDRRFRRGGLATSRTACELAPTPTHFRGHLLEVRRASSRSAGRRRSRRKGDRRPSRARPARRDALVRASDRGERRGHLASVGARWWDVTHRSTRDRSPADSTLYKPPMAADRGALALVPADTREGGTMDAVRSAARTTSSTRSYGSRSL